MNIFCLPIEMAINTVYVQWITPTNVHDSKNAWVNTMAKIALYTTPHTKIDLEDLKRTLVDGATPGSSIAHIAKQTTKYIHDHTSRIIKQFTVDISAFEAINDDTLAECMDCARSGKTTALIVTDEAEIRDVCAIVIQKTSNGQHALTVIDEQVPFSVMHKTLVTFIVSCIVNGTNPTTLDSVQPETLRSFIKERRVA